MPFRASTFRPRVESLESRDTPSTLYGLTNDNHLLQFDSASPGTVTNNVAITGLNAGERMVGIDFRPINAKLYGLAVSGNGTGFDGRLMTINPLTGAASFVGGSILIAVRQPLFPPPIIVTDPTARYDIAFNPGTGFITVTNKAGFFLSVNPDTGMVPGPGGLPFPPLNPPRVDALAYAGPRGVNNTLYAIDSATGTLKTPTPDDVNPPGVGLPLGVPIDSTGSAGLDIVPNGTAAGGLAYAVFDGDTTAGVASGLYTVNLATGAATLVGLVGDGSVALSGVAVAPESRFAVGSAAGQESKVEVYDAFTGTRLQVFNPFSGFTGGVTTAMGDVNRDGNLDVIVAAGPGGGPHVKVYDGVTGSELYSFYAYADSFRGGVSVAAGDVNGDGYDDIITGAGPGGAPHVRVLSGKDLAEFSSFYAYDQAFAGGVRVAAGHFSNIDIAYVVTAAGPGGGPHVKVFGGLFQSGSPDPVGNFLGVPTNFFAFDASFTGGVNVATGDVNGDGLTDLIVGADSGGGPHVKVFSGKDGSELSSFYAYDASFRGGVRVAAADLDRDGRVEIFVAPGFGQLAPAVRAFDTTGALLYSYDVLDGASSVFVGGGML